MLPEPIQVLRAASRPAPPVLGGQARLLIAGATGVLGYEVTRLLIGSRAYAAPQVLAREPITAVVLFDPPRLFYQRERALWTPQPRQLPALARWLRAGGVQTLAIVMPHAQMRLPQALQQGLATLDEQAIAALYFARLLIVRSAQKPRHKAAPNPLAAVARWMLSAFKYMVPGGEQPVRAKMVAQFVAHALALAPPGIHVAAPETVWQAAQGNVRAQVETWLAG